jgi:hypothetical protein
MQVVGLWPKTVHKLTSNVRITLKIRVFVTYS